MGSKHVAAAAESIGGRVALGFRAIRLRYLLPLVLIAAIALVYGYALRPWFLHWGATDAEISQSLPGDDFVKRPRFTSTRAITIAAPADRVWPWIVQMGQGRGGFYSYDWLENMLGSDVFNADRIIPGFQHLAVGDPFSLHPNMRPLIVSSLLANRALVVHTAGRPRVNLAAGDSHATWAFVLQPLGAEETRLIIRWRSTYRPTFSGRLTNQYLIEPVRFLMERKTLLGIKERAENGGSENSQLVN